MGAPGGFTLRWAARYTRGLPEEVRERRLAELASDVHEHTVAAVEAGSRAPGLAVTWRTVRGVPADVVWRRQEMRAMRHGRHGRSVQGSVLRNAWAAATHAWFAPLAVLVGVFDLLLAFAVARETDGKMPGRALGPVLATVLALLLFAGLRLQWRVRGALNGSPHEAAARSEAGTGPLLAVSALTLALLVVGVSTGGVGVFFIGLALFAVYAVLFGGRALVRAVRSTQLADKAWLADAFVVLGTLPALAMFWMVVPALLALAVIYGVVGTGPRTRLA